MSKGAVPRNDPLYGLSSLAYPSKRRIVLTPLNGVQRGLGLDVPAPTKPRSSKDGVAVRHNSGGKNFGSDKEKPPLTDMGYGRPKPKKEPPPDPRVEVAWPEEAA